MRNKQANKIKVTLNKESNSNKRWSQTRIPFALPKSTLNLITINQEQMQIKSNIISLTNCCGNRSQQQSPYIQQYTTYI